MPGAQMGPSQKFEALRWLYPIFAPLKTTNNTILEQNYGCRIENKTLGAKDDIQRCERKLGGRTVSKTFPNFLQSDQYMGVRKNSAMWKNVCMEQNMVAGNNLQVRKNMSQ